MRAHEIVDLASFVAERLVLRTNRDYPAVRQNNLGRENVIGSCAVNRNVRTGGIVRNHTADGCARAGRDVGPETKSVRIEKRIQLIEHHTRADADAAIVDVEIVDLAIVAREIDDQSFANCVPDQACAGAARCNRNVILGGGFDNGARVLRAGWKGHAEWFDLIDRRVSGVKLAGEIVEAHIATRSADPLLSGGTGHWAANLPQERWPEGTMANEML